MSTQLQVSNKDLPQYTPEQMRLIRDTIARNASNEELQLFLYRAKSMGLDPLKPGQIHFIKYGTAPGAVVVGIEGFRAFAHRTCKMSGIERGVKRDEKGKITHGWCRVYRKDWTHPAYEEVSFVEYDTGRNNWAKMPETMIKKVAEAATLRMAFPSELGGVYAEEEFEKVTEAGPSITPTAGLPQPVNEHADGLYRFPFGASPKSVQVKGLTIDKIHEKIGTDGVEEMVMKFGDILSGKEKSRMILTEERRGDMQEFIDVAELFLSELGGNSDAALG